MSLQHRVQIWGEIGGLFFNIFFIHLLYKYFNRFNKYEKTILTIFIIATFIIEFFLLSQWSKKDFEKWLYTQR